MLIEVAIKRDVAGLELLSSGSGLFDLQLAAHN